MEQMPLFAAAVLASVFAEKVSGARDIGIKHDLEDPTGLKTFVPAWFAVRTLYNIAYIQIEDHSTSFVRSLFWMVGSGLASYQIYKAATLLG